MAEDRQGAESCGCSQTQELCPSVNCFIRLDFSDTLDGFPLWCAVLPPWHIPALLHTLCYLFIYLFIHSFMLHCVAWGIFSSPTKDQTLHWECGVLLLDHQGHLHPLLFNQKSPNLHFAPYHLSKHILFHIFMFLFFLHLSSPFLHFPMALPIHPQITANQGRWVGKQITVTTVC